MNEVSRIDALALIGAFMDEDSEGMGLLLQQLDVTSRSVAFLLADLTGFAVASTIKAFEIAGVSPEHAKVLAREVFTDMAARGAGHE